MGNSLTRLLGSLFVLGAAIGTGTIGVSAFSSAPAGAAPVITVNDASDPTSTLPQANCVASPEDDCTLRAALAEANTLDEDVTIELGDPRNVPYNPSTYYSVNPGVGELQVYETGGVVDLVGAGAAAVDIRAGCPTGCTNDTRVLEIGSGQAGGAVADVSGVTISNGDAPAAEGSDCGGICVSDPGSRLTLTDSVVSGNTALTFGGGVGLYHGGSATLTDDTITGNAVSTVGNQDGGGGGIYVVNDDTSTANLTVHNTTIADNTVTTGGNGSGGGIDVFNTGSGFNPNLTIEIDQSTINGNVINGSGAQSAGGGIAASDGSWQVVDSTISDNTAGSGGGIMDGATVSSVVSATFDTIAGNSATDAHSGGNLQMQGAGTANVGESIVAGGFSNGSASNCLVAGGTLHSAGYNVIDDTSCGTPGPGDIAGQSPQLGGLGNNGGPTTTLLPASTSPALSAVPPGVTSGTGVSTDQRGENRGQGISGSSTIGAVEVAQSPTPPTPPAAAHGYWLVGSDGGIFTFGTAQFYGSTGSLVLQRPVVGIAPTSDRAGYWMVASDGGVFAYGDAGFVGSLPGLRVHPAGSGLPNSLNAPIVGMVPSQDGAGYFMVASDGGVFAFGDARFAGSCPGIGGCSGAAVAVVPDASGNGYWLLTTTGNVYAFGDAPYYGAPGSAGWPVTSAVRTADGRGYWVLTANGSVSPFGDAVSLGGPIGSVGGPNPATAIFASISGGGYWVASADGAVFAYGDAPNDGSMQHNHLNGPVIAATGF